MGIRIAIDARYVADHFPGIGRYVYSLIATLTQIEHQHRLLVIHGAALRNSRFDLASLLRHPAVEPIEARSRPFSAGEQAEIPLLLRRAHADLYHAPYYVRPYAGVPCPSVTTLYDIIPRLFPRQSTHRARLLFDALTRLAIRASNGLIAISASARDDLASAYRVPLELISVTPLAADARFRPQPPAIVAAMRARHGLPERYVLSLAANKPHKNLVGLIEAWGMAAHPAQSRPPLVIAGHWDARYPEARQAAARLGLGDTVRFLPEADEEELPALYSGAELFVFPSLYEGFGLPPLEAMACGVPVICGARSSMPEVVGDAAMLVDVADPAALAAGIDRLLADAALREQLRAGGLARAAQFSWRRTAEATLAAYERAARRA